MKFSGLVWSSWWDSELVSSWVHIPPGCNWLATRTAPGWYMINFQLVTIFFATQMLFTVLSMGGVFYFLIYNFTISSLLFKFLILKSYHTIRSANSLDEIKQPLVQLVSYANSTRVVYDKLSTCNYFFCHSDAVYSTIYGWCFLFFDIQFYHFIVVIQIFDFEVVSYHTISKFAWWNKTTFRIFTIYSYQIFIKGLDIIVF